MGSLVYLKRALGHWNGYMWPWITLAAIVNGILIVLVTNSDTGIWGVYERVIEDESKSPQGVFYIVTFVYLGPLYNLYATIIAVKSAVEADDDYHFHREDLPHLPTPDPVVRKRFISTVSLISGMALLPFTFWLYSANLAVLWGHDVHLLLQPGTFVSLLTVAASFYAIARYFPGIREALFELENSISDRIPS